MPWKVPGPGHRVGQDARPCRPCTCAADALDPAGHLAGRPAREGHQQDPPRIGAVDDQMRDPVGERVGLAGPGAGDDQERRRRRARVSTPCSTARRCSGVEFLQIDSGHRVRSVRKAGQRLSTISVLFATP